MNTQTASGAQAPLFVCESCGEALHDCERGGFHGPWLFKDAPEDVKQKAIKRQQTQAENDDFHTDCIYEDADSIASLMGIEIDSRQFKTYGGSTGSEPAIYFSGFCSQGNGACFEGSYSYKPGAVKAVKEYASQDKELHRIVEQLQYTQASAFFQLTATVKHSGHYYHSGCTSIDVTRTHPRTGDEINPTDDQEQSIKQLLRDFMDWIYSRLEAGYDYQTSEENARDYLEGQEINEEGETC